ncbi:MAG: DNA repair protein RecN [Bacteroidota bacterium]|jgi:DNA repair protein RecN (Recombination protein N)
MLQKLIINNYAIIKQVEINFHEGLNIITGETGAGKSILMGALGLVLGERADAKAIMNGEDKCIIESYFYVKPYKLQNYFNTNELDYDDICLVRREITSNGKSRAFINDTPVNLIQLKELGALLIDIVSQNETLALNDVSFQLSIIDSIAENEELLTDYKHSYNLYKKIEKQLSDLIETESKVKQSEDYNKFILNELLEAKIIEDEQDELEQSLNILSNAEEIKTITYNAYALLDYAEPSIIDQLRNVKNSILPIIKHNKTFEEISLRLEQNIIDLKDISAEFEEITDKTQANPSELLFVEERIQTLINLQKKHKVKSNSELINIQNELENELLKANSLNSEIENLSLKLVELKQSLLNKAQKLSSNRRENIPTIEKNVHALLNSVAMPDANLKIEQNLLLNNELNINGIDKIEFLFSANKGSNFQQISKVASGGELSRLMLCIKSLISEKVSLPSIVFDEIDTGISGEAALKVSSVLKKLAVKHQVLAITHLPQIAAKADAHFNVYKQSGNDKTYSNIRLLNKTEQINEIAVMLSGNNPTEQVLLAAKELMNN